MKIVLVLVLVSFGFSAFSAPSDLKNVTITQAANDSFLNCVYKLAMKQPEMRGITATGFFTKRAFISEGDLGNSAVNIYFFLLPTRDMYSITLTADNPSGDSNGWWKKTSDGSALDDGTLTCPQVSSMAQLGPSSTFDISSCQQ